MKKLIVVDDSRSILATVGMAMEPLTQNGFVELITYLDPSQLYDDLISGRADFDLLISDINMPQMDGLELCQKIAEDPRFRNKPILVLTTESSGKRIEQARMIGVTGWMTKPISNDKLLKTVKMVMEL